MMICFVIYKQIYRERLNEIICPFLSLRLINILNKMLFKLKRGFGYNRQNYFPRLFRVKINVKYNFNIKYLVVKFSFSLIWQNFNY